MGTGCVSVGCGQRVGFEPWQCRAVLGGTGESPAPTRRSTAKVLPIRRVYGPSALAGIRSYFYFGGVVAGQAVGCSNCTSILRSCDSAESRTVKWRFLSLPDSVARQEWKSQPAGHAECRAFKHLSL